jgi:hypothetical protein
VNVEDMVLVSIDDHVIEPRDMFDHHVPDKWRDQAPRSVLNDDGIERWTFEGIESGSGSLNAVVGWAHMLLSGKLDDLFWEMIEWRPAPDSHYFDFLAERAAWVTYDGKGQTSIRWRVGADGEKRLYVPGI